MRLLLPLIWNSLFISSWITLQRLHCGLGLLVDPLCVDTYYDSSQERNATTLDILSQFTTATWNAIREFPEDSPRWLRSPTPCSPRLHTWHGLSSQYHHLGDPIRITRFYYSHKRRDWTGRLTLTRSTSQDQLIDISPINNWSTPVGQQLILSDVPRCLPCWGEYKEVTDTIYLHTVNVNHRLNMHRMQRPVVDKDLRVLHSLQQYSVCLK